MWFDSHCHFDLERPDEALSALEKAVEAGVTGCLVQGTSMRNCPFVIELAHRVPGVYAAVGIHPHDAEGPKDIEQMRKWWKDEKVRAVGEIGLDYFYDFADKAAQRSVFAEFLQEAADAGLPVVIHCREAFQDGFAMVKDCLSVGHPFEVHSFSGTADEAEKWIELGAMMSINGMVTFKKADNIRAILDVIPDERLLLETDSPYLAPVPFRGKENTPATIPVIGAYVAERRGMSPGELALLTTGNALRFLNIEK